MKLNSGWGTTDGMSPELLILLGWVEYIETASVPYPLSVLDTEENKDCLRQHELRKQSELTNERKANETNDQ